MAKNPPKLSEMAQSQLRAIGEYITEGPFGDTSHLSAQEHISCLLSAEIYNFPKAALTAAKYLLTALRVREQPNNYALIEAVRCAKEDGKSFNALSAELQLVKKELDTVIGRAPSR